MKAETILKLIERALNPDLKQAHIKAYAQAMIEKDRESIIENTSLVDRLKLIKTYSNTTIILD